MLSPFARMRLALLAGACLTAFAGAASAQPPGEAAPAPIAPAAAPLLTLRDALAAAAAVDPSLAVTQARLAVEDAAVRRAGLQPNAEINAEIENFGGTGPYLLDRFEATLSYEKALERGGKRQARTARAQAELPVIRLRGEIRGLDFLKEVQLAYAEVLTAEAELLVADARLVSAVRAQEQVDRRVTSARDPLFAGSRAEALTAQAHIARDVARERARAARSVLAALTGRTAAFSVRLEDFFEVMPQARAALGTTPDIEILEAERDIAVAEIRLAETAVRPDPKVRAGVRYLADDTDLALVVGGSIPLGVARASQPAIERARASRTVAEQEIAVERAQREREIARLSDRMNALAGEAERVRAEVLPHTLRTVEQVLEGFARGGFEYNDVNQAEIALVDARLQRIQALAEHHRLKAQRDRLTAAHRGILSTSEERR